MAKAVKAGAGKGDDETPIPWKVQLAVYATGTFGNTMNNIVTIVLPLWALHLGASPLMIGLVLGARHFLPTLFSIHGGALMDRLGTRRVLMWFAVIGATTPFLYPVLPFLWVVLLLQLLDGLSSSFAWMGAQAQVGQLMKGKPLYAGRLSFTLRFGHLIAPLMAGGAWDLFGPWGGFGVMAIWGVGVLVSASALPRPPRDEPKPKVHVADVVPRFSDYVEAVKMLAVPAILLVVMCTTLRMSGQGMHQSFYIVYLEEIGLTGTMIGILMSVGSLAGFAGALSVAPLCRFFQPHWFLVSAVTVGALSVAVTPLLGGIYALLMIASVTRSLGMSTGQPLMITVLSGAAGERQGKAFAIRATANRLVTFAVPVLMGLVVELVGLDMSFMVIGVALAAFGLAISFYIQLNPELRAARRQRAEAAAGAE